MTTSSTDRDLLTTLNGAQRRAVTSRSDTLAILAGPGSGKTHTLTSRVAWLINHHGYQPCNVIVATFTVKAAKEMKERIGKALGDGREKSLVLGTFHSIARRYLCAYGTHIGLDRKFDIADDNDSRTAIRRICKRRGLAIDPAVAKSMISKEKAKGVTGTAELTAKDKKKESEDFRICFDDYQEYLARAGLLDYDDLLVRAVQLLEIFPKCVSNVQAVLVDEYQDTNTVQYELMCKFAQACRRITIVGDPDQSIYGWRSAEIKNLHRLLHEFPGTEEVALEENYRSSHSILATSLQVIQEDTRRYKKILRSTHAKGPSPVLRKLPSAEDEGEWIVSELRRVVMLSGDMISYNDVAILIRSASLSRSIESALGTQGIPYRMVGGAKFFDRTEVKLLLDYLHVINIPNNNEALLRIINVPKRGIGKTSIQKLLDEAEAQKTSLWEIILRHCRGQHASETVLRKAAAQSLSGGLIRLIQGLRHRTERQEASESLTVADVIRELVAELEIETHLKAMDPDKWESRWANVEEFIQLAEHFTASSIGLEEQLPTVEGVEQEVEVGALGRFLSTISLTSAADSMPGATEQVNNKPMVTISTIHAAKGLEWPVVFIPAVYTGSIPHSRSEDSDEERRLLFVAMTRAQAFLYLSYPTKGSNSGDYTGLELSCFVTPPIEREMAKRGPSFNQKLLDEVAEILKCDPPKLDQIYKGLPPMVCPEDTRFISPDSSSTDHKRPSKRQRTNGYAGYGDSQEVPLQMSYSTTMDQASKFTVSSFPGFVRASSYCPPQAPVSQPTRDTPPHNTSRGSNKRPPGQQSLLGFITGGTTLEGRGSHAAAPPSVGQRAPVRPSAPARPHAIPTPPVPVHTDLDPSVRNHSLGAHKRRDVPTTKTMNIEGARSKYPMFSSSPHKPDKENEDTSVKRTAEDDDAVVEISARCFHSTTMTMSRGGFNKPAPLKRGSIAHIDRLRKPFKPLTINRQGRS